MSRDRAKIEAYARVVGSARRFRDAVRERPGAGDDSAAFAELDRALDAFDRAFAVPVRIVVEGGE